MYISSAFSFIATGFMFLVGGFDLAFKTLAIVMLLDYITGVISAIYQKKVNSKIGFKGILKKSLYFVVIILATLLDVLLNQNVSRYIVIYFFVANDGISILENISKCNVKLPNKLLEVLEQLKNEND